MIRTLDLERAESEGIMAGAQRQAIVELARRRGATDGAARFTFTHVLYYLGGLIAIGAASLFMTPAWLVVALVPLAVYALQHLLGVLLRRAFTVFGGIGIAIVLVDEWRSRGA